jgi:hypothetical protein
MAPILHMIIWLIVMSYYNSSSFVMIMLRKVSNKARRLNYTSLVLLVTITVIAIGMISIFGSSRGILSS